jgi:predicted alpha/beta-fold hydrolase
MPSERRLFTIAPGSRLLGHCHWQLKPTHHPTLVLVHGLEGCIDSHYMRGIASKAWKAGFNVIRLNQRNCGGTEHETPTLYHSGLSADLLAIVTELAAKDGLDRMWFAGYSMGGNLVLRLAGEIGNGFSPVKGVVAVCPNIDPAACVDALETGGNWLYHRYFLSSMQARLRRKAVLFPGLFDTSGLRSIRTMRAFDDVYTAPNGGFRDSADYYERTGARHVVGHIAVPTLILTAGDDPFIPVRIFNNPALMANPAIQLVVTRHGGHCGFLQRLRSDEDSFWAENRLIDFIRWKAGIEREKSDVTVSYRGRIGSPTLRLP